MMKRYQILFFALVALLNACNADEYVLQPADGALELNGIQAGIGDAEAALTRSADALTVSVGRTQFVTDDTIVFTTIRRTDNPLTAFSYGNIPYRYNGSSWNRTTTDPEKLYWTDGSNCHTFIGYSLPAGYYWEPVANGTGSDTYAGELGYGKTSVSFASNDDIRQEDPLILYSDTTKADNGGLTTTVYFNHALSNVRVVVNIRDFAASSGAVDTMVTVSDMVLLNQPCKYTWGADSKDAIALAFDADEQITRDIALWCPEPAGEGTAQSKTFTFYGLTTPQNATFHEIEANRQYLQFSFTVKYPDATDTARLLTHTYTGTFSQLVNFQSGVCTTLNIALNHRNEQMFLDVAYNDWDDVATPDLGELRKKSTFMDISSKVTTHNMSSATADDATWLYLDGTDIKDIYGNDGSAASPYRITTASQLLSFAKEVNGGYTFVDKYVHQDADITMQASTAKTSADDSTSAITPVTWIGIGNSTYAFNGTFWGGDRYINRLYGSPLFVSLGDSACVEQLYITAIGPVTNGALASTNAGIIGGCKVIDDVTLSDGAGALVGTNSSTGVIHACYYTGTSGNLIGSDKGTAKGCYQASQLPSLTYKVLDEFVSGLNTELSNWYNSNPGKYKNKYSFTYTIGSYPTVQVEE